MNRVSTIDLPLSQREKSIARLLAWGYTQKEIASKLFVSPLTISTHMRNIYRKLEIHKESDLTRCWIFYEYAIADNPLKRFIALFFLFLACTAALTEQSTVRVFRSNNLTPVTKVARAARGRRYENVFDIHLALTA